MYDQPPVIPGNDTNLSFHSSENIIIRYLDGDTSNFSFGIIDVKENTDMRPFAVVDDSGRG